MDPIKFGEDLAKKSEFAYQLANHKYNWPDLSNQVLDFMGMGSSAYAAQAIAIRLQAAGINANFTLASNPTPPKANKNKTLIMISASGNSIESKSSFEKALGYREKIWLSNTNLSNSYHIDLAAQLESSGVASLTYLATHIALLKLAQSLNTITEIDNQIVLAAEAIADIYARSNEWLPILEKHISSPAGAFFIAPMDRFCSAQQSALMIRECPRISAVACETGDWSHVDVYLTKTLDYRAVIFPGSIWEDQLLEWCLKRESKVLAIGFENSKIATAIRYKHDNNPIVRLLAETSFAEVLAQSLWVRQRK